MTTDLVLFDPVFARFQTTDVPILHRQLHQACLPFDVDLDHDVNWRFYDPALVHLDDLEGLDYYDQARVREPDLVTPAFLDAYELEHVSTLGHTPRSQWYRDARQAQRLAARRARQARLTRDWAIHLDGGTFSLGDGDDSTSSGTEEFSDTVLPFAKVRVKTWTGPTGVRHSGLSAFDKDGTFLDAPTLLRSRQTVERYRDRTVAETAIFHPVNGDGLTLDEMLSEMRRFETVTGASEWQPDPAQFPESGAPDYDHRYVAPDDARRRIRAAKQVVAHAELKAAAVEICRFPWSDDQAKSDPARARGWVRRSRLLEWGTDTWQVILCRKQHRNEGVLDVDDPTNRNFWTVFVRTHTGSETVTRTGRPDLQVWTWEPHYYLTFPDEETGTQWLERLEDAFLRERHGDLDMERWPNDLLNDRSVAAAQAAAQWKIWQRHQRDGWRITNLDRTPGQIEFVPNEALSYDPTVLQSQVGYEHAESEAEAQ